MNILYPLIEDRAWATDRIVHLEKENAKLEAENEELRVDNKELKATIDDLLEFEDA